MTSGHFSSRIARCMDNQSTSCQVSREGGCVRSSPEGYAGNNFSWCSKVLINLINRSELRLFVVLLDLNSFLRNWRLIRFQQHNLYPGRYAYPFRWDRQHL